MFFTLLVVNSISKPQDILELKMDLLCSMFHHVLIKSHIINHSLSPPSICSCTCPAEWFGPHCTSRYDDCAGGGQDLCEHGVCIDSDRVTPNQVKTTTTKTRTK